MGHTREYLQVCNEILKALQEIKMWAESMETAIDGIAEIIGEEKDALIETISEEITNVEKQLIILRHKFKLMNDKSKD